MFTGTHGQHCASERERERGKERERERERGRERGRGLCVSTRETLVETHRPLSVVEVIVKPDAQPGSRAAGANEGRPGARDPICFLSSSD